MVFHPALPSRIRSCCLMLVVFAGFGVLSLIRTPRVYSHGSSTAPSQAFELAKNFSGKVNPYLAVGLRMGDYAMNRLGVAKYSLKVIAALNPEPPQSYMLDGLQISTGATFGNRKMEYTPSSKSEVMFINANAGGGQVTLSLSKNFHEHLSQWTKDWDDPEIVALYIYTLPTIEDIFEELR